MIQRARMFQSLEDDLEKRAGEIAHVALWAGSAASYAPDPTDHEAGWSEVWQNLQSSAPGSTTFRVRRVSMS